MDEASNAAFEASNALDDASNAAFEASNATDEASDAAFDGGNATFYPGEMEGNPPGPMVTGCFRRIHHEDHALNIQGHKEGRRG